MANIGSSSARRAFAPKQLGRTFVPKLMAVVAIIALLGFAGVNAVGFVGGRLAKSPTAESADTGFSAAELSSAETYTLDYDPTVASLASIPSSGESVVGFSLVGDGIGYVPALSADQRAAIQAVLDEYAPNDRTVSFAFVDLSTGSGYAYNVDAEVYSASSIKAHLAVFACQDQVESGKISLSSFKSNAENAILWSDNDSYYRLRRASNGYGANNAFDAWIANLGLDPSVSEKSFPYYSARESIQLWMNAYLYLQSGDPELTEWLKGLFSGTDVSMIRDAIEGTPFDSSGEGVSSGSLSTAPGRVKSALLSSVEPECTVYNKAGWISGNQDNAVNDAGIIVSGDDVYLMSVLTSAPDSAGNRQLLSNLVSAIWAARDTLQPEGFEKA